MKIRFFMLICVAFILTACSGTQPTPDPFAIPPTVPPLSALMPETLLGYSLRQDLSRPSAATYIYANPQNEQIVLQVSVRNSVKQAERGYTADGNIVNQDIPGVITPNIYAFNGAYSVYFNKYYFLFESRVEAKDQTEDTAKREKVIAFARALSDYMANK
jgi:hypothetical protein